jgi:hypothetical protein
MRLSNMAIQMEPINNIKWIIRIVAEKLFLFKIGQPQIDQLRNDQTDVVSRQLKKQTKLWRSHELFLCYEK